MRDRTAVGFPTRVSVGGLSRAELTAELTARGIRLNVHAETLIDEFEQRAPDLIGVTERTVEELGFTDGASLSQIFDAALRAGLRLCPADTGPYLRLALIDQPDASDSVMSSGRAPSGSVTVASAPVSMDDEHPKGFYLRVVDGESWLRGYRCDDEHVWSPDDRFVFRVS